MDPNDLTPQNAPRTAPELLQAEPYRVRRLAEIHLAGLRTEEEKLAWYGMKTMEARVNYVVALLKRWDEQNPGGYAPGTNGTSAPATPAPEATRAPVTSATATRSPAVQQMAPMLPGGTINAPLANGSTAGAAPMIPQVSASAVAGAMSATADNKPKRAPKTTATETPPADLSADIINLLNRISKSMDDDKERFSGLAEDVKKSLEEAASAKSSRLENQLKSIDNRFEALITQIAGIQQLQTCLLMLVMSSQADATNSSVVDVLRQAMEGADGFQNLIGLARGKA